MENKMSALSPGGSEGREEQVHPLVKELESLLLMQLFLKLLILCIICYVGV